MKGSISLLSKQAPALLLCLAAAVLSQSASAADTQLNITGNIKASPCKVNVPTGGLMWIWGRILWLRHYRVPAQPQSGSLSLLK